MPRGVSCSKPAYSHMIRIDRGAGTEGVIDRGFPGGDHFSRGNVSCGRHECQDGWMFLKGET